MFLLYAAVSFWMEVVGKFFLCSSAISFFLGQNLPSFIFIVYKIKIWPYFISTDTLQLRNTVHLILCYSTNLPFFTNTTDNTILSNHGHSCWTQLTSLTVEQRERVHAHSFPDLYIECMFPCEPRYVIYTCLNEWTMCWLPSHDGNFITVDSISIINYYNIDT